MKCISIVTVAVNIIIILTDYYHYQLVRMYYRRAGIFGGIKIWQIAHFCDWRFLIWQISRHVSLSMRTVDENGGFNFGE